MPQNYFVNILPLINQQRSFWADCFDQSDENKAYEFLKNLQNQSPENQIFLTDESKDLELLKKIFVIKNKLAERTEGSVIEASQMIFPLIDEVFQKLYSEESAEEFDKLKANLSNYAKLKSVPLLNLYLQFLIRSNFFANDDDKKSYFVGFHSLIGNCEGGMITRLYEYVQSNVIEEKIRNQLQDFLLQDDSIIPAGNHIHVSAFIKKYLFGQKHEDSAAISIAQFIPVHLMQKLCKKTLVGDYVAEVFSSEVESYFKFLLNSKENHELLLSYHNPQNPYGSSLKDLCRDFVNRITTITGDNHINENLVTIPGAIIDLVYEDENYRTLKTIKDRKKILGEKFSEDEIDYNVYVEVAEQVIPKIIKQVTELPENLEEEEVKRFESFVDTMRKQKLFLTAQEKNDLENLGELYAIFLSRGLCALTQKQFLDKFENYLEINGSADQSYLSLSKASCALLQQEGIKNYINQNLEFLTIKTVEDVKEIATSYKNTGNSYPKEVAQDLKINSRFADPNFVIPSELDPRFNFTHYLYVLCANEDLNQDSVDNALTKFVESPYCERALKKYRDLEFFAGREEVFDKFLLKVIKNFSSERVKSNSESLFNIVELLKNDQEFALNIFFSIACELENKVFNDHLLEMHDEVGDDPIVEILETELGLKILNNSPEKFLYILKTLEEEEGVLKLFSNYNKTIAEKLNPQDIVSFFANSFEDKDKIAVLETGFGEVFVEHHPESFANILDDIPENNLIAEILLSSSGKAFARKAPDLFFKALKQIIDGDNEIEYEDEMEDEREDENNYALDIIHSESGKILLENRPDLFLQIAADCCIEQDEIESFFCSEIGDILCDRYCNLEGNDGAQNLKNDKLESFSENSFVETLLEKIAEKENQSKKRKSPSSEPEPSGLEVLQRTYKKQK